MLLSSALNTFRSAILSLPADLRFTREDLLIPELRLSADGLVETFYAPHNDYVHSSASLFIVGLTPGFTQMRIAYEAARHAMDQGLGDEAVCRRAKEAASFAGSPRANLISMLDELGMPEYLGIGACEALFGAERRLLHTSSVLRYPVFVNRANYNGSRPSLLGTPSLRDAALNGMAEELGAFQVGPFIIPLGTAVESVLQLLAGQGMLDAGQCLWGFPHPSGANGHRHKQFAARKAEMKKSLRRYFS
ncbi:hypothetical protein FHS19_005340 [Paenibacillus rhizosphaerae]|uniref:Uracil-DNA glycosylase-like domain-containing protein n=1 Tax=Paenibacillus rhizosphaerae TaxID=297318 RepID=A0A839TVT6_9BACL|nr:hypothetical protein [Paenibacillus rhizosphaerae]MBB3130621.1 hypothetical protein [Paenibacillus rhizosphaerae]